jgi:hypothetical protein
MEDKMRIEKNNILCMEIAGISCIIDKIMFDIPSETSYDVKNKKKFLIIDEFGKKDKDYPTSSSKLDNLSVWMYAKNNFIWISTQNIQLEGAKIK